MRLPLVYPYRRFEALLKKHGTLSLRKQFCFAYIEWGYRGGKEAKERFIELAKEFRKEENKIGKERTLLERKARKLFRKHNWRKKHESTWERAAEWATESKEKGIGVHSPEYKAKLTEHNRRIAKLRAERGQNFAKDWLVHSPDGEVFQIRSLETFCKENGFAPRKMLKTQEFPGKTYDGWWVERLDKEWEQLN